jgi:predicted outer membrane repeat protein
MHYFRPSLCSEDAFAAWDSQLAQAAEEPWLKKLSRRDLLPLFIQYYSDLRALPRGARRDLQRKVIASREIAVPAGWRLKLAGSLAGTALLLALGQASRAATITVNTNIARIAADGKCSLVEAIINANNDAATHADCVAGSGPDTIMLPAASAHVVPGIYDTVYGSRLPLITSTITIEGNGGIIQGTKKGGAGRLIAVKGSGDLTLQNITLSGSRIKGNGGAILNYGSVSITNNSLVTGNSGDRGGAIYNGSGAVLHIDNSTLTRNTGGEAAGIYNNHGTVTIQNSFLTANSGSYRGAIGSRNGTITIVDSVLSGNKATKGQGGAIYTAQTDLTIDGSMITNNTSGEFGAGIMFRFDGDLTITSSTIAGNTTRFDGGALSADTHGTVLISHSTISGNKSKVGAGGISTFVGNMTIENSTVSGNTGGYAGGLYCVNTIGSLTVSDSTVTGNKAKGVGGILTRGPVTLNRSLISGNTGIIPEVYRYPSGSVTVDNFNLIGVNGKPGILGFALGSSDILPPAGVTIIKILAPLANNGGPTFTHALVTGSPAIDAVPVLNCPSDDQRGVSRPQGAQCDIGAFEK